MEFENPRVARYKQENWPEHPGYGMANTHFGFPLVALKDEPLQLKAASSEDVAVH